MKLLLWNQDLMQDGLLLFLQNAIFWNKWELTFSTKLFIHFPTPKIKERNKHHIWQHFRWKDLLIILDNWVFYSSHFCSFHNTSNSICKWNEKKDMEHKRLNRSATKVYIAQSLVINVIYVEYTVHSYLDYTFHTAFISMNILIEQI